MWNFFLKWFHSNSIFRTDTYSKILGLPVACSSVLQNLAAFLLVENRWHLHLEVSFAPMGVYPLTGVMELFLVNFHLKVAEEQFSWYRFLPCCVIFFLLLHVLVEESCLFVVFSFQGIFCFYNLDCHKFVVGKQFFFNCRKSPSILFWKWGAVIKRPFVFSRRSRWQVSLLSFLTFAVSFTWTLSRRPNRFTLAFYKSSAWSFVKFLAFGLSRTAERTFFDYK